MQFLTIQNGRLVPIQSVSGDQMGQLAQIAQANNQPMQPTMGATMPISGMVAPAATGGGAPQGIGNMLSSFVNGYYQRQALQQQRQFQKQQQQETDPFGGKGTNAANPHLNAYQGFDPFSDNEVNTVDPFGGSGTTSSVAQALTTGQDGI